eukprot:10297773-Karenia_brevis.AAC.1
MRNGQVYLRDYEDFIDVHRDSKTGLRVSNVSSFPKDSASLPLSALVPDIKEKSNSKQLILRTDSPIGTPPELIPDSPVSSPRASQGSSPEDGSSRIRVAMPANQSSGLPRSRPGTPRTPKAH